MKFPGVVTELQNALACAARIFELIEETPADSATHPTLLALQRAEGRVTLGKRLRFRIRPDRNR